MSNNWIDAGPHTRGPILDFFDALAGDQERHIEKPETGEHKIAFIGKGQTLGEAIEKGQVRDDDCS